AAAATNRSIAAGSVTSRWAVWTMPPPSRAPASGASSSMRRSPAQTVAPRSANAVTIARPIPRAAPVTITRRLENSMCTSAQLFGRGLAQGPDDRGGYDRGGDQIKGVRERRAESVDEQDRDEGRKAPEDRDRQRIAGRHPGRAGAGREYFRDRRRSRA